ncbi:MAG TPA: addiction module antidote protein [Geminicoccaceae bacterium]|nr:addiction module antidote protein [Geminicoccaceae bacterium]
MRASFSITTRSCGVSDGGARDHNPEIFLAGVGHVAKARGLSAIAERAGPGRESLYNALTPGAKPRYDTVPKVLHSFGVKLTVRAA